MACACLEGNDVALATFEAEYTARLPALLGRLRLDEAVVEDLTSTVREKLFVTHGDGSPLIKDYSGRGALFAWLRSIAVHAALKLKRRAGRETDLGTAFELASPEANPELVYLKRRYAADFKGSLERAFRVITTRERNLLRQHYFDALTIDDLGVLYRVHRATAARWVADARKSVLKAVRADLMSNLALADNDVEALWASAQSDLEASISRLLGPGEKGVG
jgi:RNA polymerase sigma-70 factor (ECF subfamily)